MYIYLRRLIFLEREKVRTHPTSPSSRSAPEYILHPWSLNFDTFISSLKYSRKFLTSSCAECHLGTSFCVSTADACELYGLPSLFSNVSRKNEIIKTGLKRRISYSINKIKYIHVILKPTQEISVRWAHFFFNFQ